MIAQAWKGELILRAIAYLIVGLLFLCFKAFGQNWVEERTYVSQGVATPRIDGLFTKSLTKQWGSFVWFQTQKGYSQAYAGPLYSPKPWLQLALGAGIEQDQHETRIGSYVWLGRGKISGLGIFEDRGSGFWYKVETNYQLTAKLGVGTLSEHFRGHGPKVEITVPHTPLKLWFAPLVQDNSVRPLIGVRWNL